MRRRGLWGVGVAKVQGSEGRRLRVSGALQLRVWGFKDEGSGFRFRGLVIQEQGLGESDKRIRSLGPGMGEGLGIN